ncbi:MULTISPECIES: NAD(P)H-dependent oxidoreductase [unclassified Motilimonas]|uniref:NAD(P)H-dependent oxidoreductase n=1 Tax=Motilimonas TaxID=1914248 RepID=UPI001E4C6A2E|nr:MULTISPECIES: NAD(P)H-dependent oxidoreductase [unclassified Motilimonas]MDO6525283.1 NAD(P)H-dependent oxidoreductase [Motilimonas sp. 1_MG-2023]
MKKVLILNANPKRESLNKAMGEAYKASIIGKHEVVSVNIGELDFQADLTEGYDKVQPLEPDLEQLQLHISWADHIVIISPVWWGSMPAKFKGAIDRTFLSGFAFSYEEGKSIPKKLLKGKTSELIFTLDTPVFWYKLVQGNVIYKHLKRTILDFVGIKTVATQYFGPVISSKPEARNAWQNIIARQAAKL